MREVGKGSVVGWRKAGIFGRGCLFSVVGDRGSRGRVGGGRG